MLICLTLSKLPTHASTAKIRAAGPRKYPNPPCILADEGVRRCGFHATRLSIDFFARAGLQRCQLGSACDRPVPYCPVPYCPLACRPAAARVRPRTLRNTVSAGAGSARGRSELRTGATPHEGGRRDPAGRRKEPQ